MEHVGIGFARNREGLQGKACGVCPVRSQTEPLHHHFPLLLFALWHGDLLTTGGKISQHQVLQEDQIDRAYQVLLAGILLKGYWGRSEKEG